MPEAGAKVAGHGRRSDRAHGHEPSEAGVFLEPHSALAFEEILGPDPKAPSQGMDVLQADVALPAL